MIYGLGAYGVGDLIQTHLYVEGFWIFITSFHLVVWILAHKSNRQLMTSAWGV